jgi:hypothetical protein
LLASGIYGIVKIVATAIFIFFGIERFGRRMSLVIGLAGMSLFLWIIGAIFNTHREFLTRPVLSRASARGKADRRRSARRLCRIALASVDRHGCVHLPLCHPLLLLGRTGPLGVLRRDLQQPNAKLWSLDSEQFAMALELDRLEVHAQHGRRAQARWYRTSICSRGFCFCFCLPPSPSCPRSPRDADGKFFFFAGINVFAAICAFFLPETKGKPYPWSYIGERGIS